MELSMSANTIKSIFSISGTSTGGRNGHSETSDHLVSVDLATPKEMGGAGKPGAVTPEHLFAAGYAACFGGAVEAVAKKHKKDASKAKTTCLVMFGPREGGSVGLAVKMTVEDKSIPTDELKAFVTEAHEKICPYSHATRGNIDITFDVVGG
jgi:osmotically inducible protein OsmC